jgi:hypothetical protein
LDLFTFSTFDNQSTKDGGRGYIPIVGKIWQGFFSDLPVVGNLFSWKKDPQNVYHQSVLLANTLITPTVMAIASVYDQTKDDQNSSDSCPPVSYYDNQQLNNYKEQLKFVPKNKSGDSEREMLKTRIKEIEDKKRDQCFQILKDKIKEYKKYVNSLINSKNERATSSNKQN